MSVIDEYFIRYKVVLVKDDSVIELFASYSKSVAIDKAKHLYNQQKWTKRYSLVSGNKYIIRVLDDDQNEYLTKHYSKK